MTMSTFSTGFLIAVIMIALEFLEKDNRRRAEEFLSFE